MEKLSVLFVAFIRSSGVEMPSERQEKEDWRKKLHPWKGLLFAFLGLLLGVCLAYIGGCFAKDFWGMLVGGDYWVMLMTMAFAFILAFAITIIEKYHYRKKNKGWSTAKDISDDFLLVIVSLFVIGEYFECIARNFLVSPRYSILTVGGVLLLTFLLSFFFISDYLRGRPNYALANKMIILGILWFFWSAVYSFSCRTGSGQYFCENLLTEKLLAWDRGTAIFSVLISLSGVALTILEKEKKRRRKEKEEALRLQAERIRKLLQAPEGWLAGVQELLEGDFKELSRPLQDSYDRLCQKVEREWENNFLSVISQRLKAGASIADVLDTQEELFAHQQRKDYLKKKGDAEAVGKREGGKGAVDRVESGEKAEGKDEDDEEAVDKEDLWKQIISCYRNDAAVKNCQLENIFELWDIYDYPARELCVDLLIRYDSKGEMDLEMVMEELKRDRRRLWRHPRLQERKLFQGVNTSEITSKLKYTWPDLLRKREDQEPNPRIKLWLQAKNIEYPPFGPFYAENIDPKSARFYSTEDIDKILLKPGAGWIGGKHGGGRTALGIYSYQAKGIDPSVFPMHHFVRVLPTGERGWLTMLLELLSKTLLDLLIKRPDDAEYYRFDAFVDLAEERQRQFALLLSYGIGSCQIILDQLPVDSVPSPETNGAIEKKRRKALELRLRELFRQMDQADEPSYFLLQSLLSTRPADLSETHIILDIQPELSPLQVHTLLSLAEELEAFQVYLKILSVLPQSELWLQSDISFSLSWKDDDLKKMLRTRKVHLMFDFDEETVLQEFVEYAKGLPRRMVQLVNQVLPAVVDLEPDELLTLKHLRKAKDELESSNNKR